MVRSRLVRAGLLVTVAAGAVWVISGVGLATADSDRVSESGRTLHVLPTDSGAFDISWVEQSTGRYFLADRTNAAVQWFSLAGDVNGDAFAASLGKGQFVGPGPQTASCIASHACGGPNGVVTDKQHRVWAGDGPVNGTNSIKMIDLPVSQSVTKSIPLGGTLRADELAYDPNDQVIEIASDADGFLSFVSTVPGGEGLASTFYYKDNDVGKGASAPGTAAESTAGNGIEQPVWDNKTGRFYQAIPGTPKTPGPATTGRVDVFTPGGTFVRSFKADGCDGGPTGLVLTDIDQLIGACGNGGLVMDVHNGHVITIIRQVGGADEVWFNPGDGNAYFAMSGTGQLGVVDAERDRFVTTLPTQAGSHSVAAYQSRTNQILVPLAGNGVRVFVSPGKDQD
ncbi:MAG: hypothetical protein JO352_24610 [Chloroflexi bacterium]|nr:hypothetical protein [Chloroflexota bacterium]MBV9600753.1 hypothetical protein [Chloroflexota bacterium]